MSEICTCYCKYYGAKYYLPKRKQKLKDFQFSHLSISNRKSVYWKKNVWQKKNLNFIEEEVMEYGCLQNNKSYQH